MLNLQHYYVIIFYPALLALVSTISVLLINYLYYVKNLLFNKLKTKKKMLINSEIFILGSYSMNTLALAVMYVYFNLKYSAGPHLYFKNFIFYKYSFSVFIILGFLSIFINLLFKHYYNLNICAK